MKITVKTFWTTLLLMIICSTVSYGNVFMKVGEPIAFVSVPSTSVAASSCFSSSVVSASEKVEEAEQTFTNTKYVWTEGVELGNKPVSETFSSNQQRVRRVIEDNIFLRNILFILSLHENLLVLGQTKLYYSEPSTSTPTDYYIYTLRRILI